MTMKKPAIFPFLFLLFLLPEVQGQSAGRETPSASCPDSVITFKFDAQGDSALNAKMAFRYDNHLHTIESEKFVREQSLNLWTPDRRDVWEYDNHDRRTLWAIYEWDNNTMAYKGWMKETTRFDNHGNQAEYHYYTWDYTFYDWGNRFWDLFEYDDENKLTRRDHLEWNLESEQWDTASYDIYDYGDDGLLERLTLWEPDWVQGSGILYPYDRGDYEYDECGNIVRITHQIYNPYTQIWYWSERHQYAYDAQNRKTQWMYSEYDEQGENWIDKEKEDWGWDENDSLTLYAYYRIGEDLETWYPDIKAEMIYNGYGKLVNYRSYSGNNAARWVQAYERRYPYMNDTLLMADSLFQWMEDEQVWELVDCNNYQYDSLFRMHTDSYYKLVVHTGEYLLSFRDYYFYSATAGVEEQGEGQEEKRGCVKVWPNPTAGQFNVQCSIFNVEFETSELVDIYGKVLIAHNIRAMGQLNNETLELDISHLPPGIYFIRIHLENQTIVKKIVKL